MKKVIILDVMGVIFQVGDDTKDLLVPYVLNLNQDIPQEKIVSLYKDASLGKISSCKFWVDLGFKVEDVEAIEQKYLETCLTIDKQFIQSIDKVKAKGYIVALLSNDVSEWSQYLRRIHGIDKYVNFAFISGDLGLRKPDQEIYKAALKKMKVQPSDCIFIDDHPARVDAAIELGIPSILFNRENHEYKGLQISSFLDLLKVLGITDI
jgi:putative hydrolase of the HAD superfamily